MTRELLVARVKAHTHRVNLWKTYKAIVRMHPEKYRIVYDHVHLQFKLQIKTRFMGWRSFAESQTWYMHNG